MATWIVEKVFTDSVAELAVEVRRDTEVKWPKYCWRIGAWKEDNDKSILLPYMAVRSDHGTLKYDMVTRLGALIEAAQGYVLEQLEANEVRRAELRREKDEAGASRDPRNGAKKRERYLT